MISAAVVTSTPFGSVPVSVPTFVMKEPLLWNVPLTVPDATVKMNVFDCPVWTFVFAGMVQVIVPEVPVDEPGTPSVPLTPPVPPLYVKPLGSVSDTHKTVMSVPVVLLRVRRYVTKPLALVVTSPAG